jgi:hypothetical protein
MSAEERCLQLIERVREAACDPAAAYLIRSRLRRAILGCARMVANAHGAAKPEMPGQFVAPDGCSAADNAILALCNRIHGIALELCQPSESFDVRWADGWALLQHDLGRLHRAVATRRDLAIEARS